MLRNSLAAVALSALAVGACDRVPTDPSLDVASLMVAGGAVASGDLKPVSTTLPALFRQAIATTEEQQGKVGVDALLGDWRDLQDDLTKIAPSADRSTITAKLDAIHAAELDVVLHALGGSVVSRVLSDASQGLASAESRLSSNSQPQDVAQATVVVQQVREKMAAARSAIALNDLPHALDLGSQAVTLISGLNFYLVELQRINGLETLFPKAVEALKNDAANPRAQGLLVSAERSSIAARSAMQLGDRSAAQTQLAQARTQQINVVLSVLGTAAAAQLVHQTVARTAMLRNVLAAMGDAVGDTTRLKRMLNEANDLSQRARTALDNGDAATALDLGSHAAGMLNALQHLTWK